MTLSARLVYSITKKVRKGGQSCYDFGQVQIQDGSESSVTAQIQNSYRDNVTLDFEDGNTLVAFCDCFLFERDGMCKHVWATILAADKQGFLSEAASAPSVVLESDYFGPDELGDEPAINSRSNVVKVFSPPLPPPPPPKPTWRAQIAEISASRTDSRFNTEAWPAKRELLYIIDISIGAPPRDLTISMEIRDQKRDGAWGHRKALNLKLSQIRNLPLAEDREILSMLAGGKGQYSWSYDYDSVPTPCHIRHPLSQKLMPLLAQTGRCYLRTQRSNENIGALLTWDDSGAWQFALQVRGADKGGWTITGILRRGEERMELSVPILLTQGGLVFTPGRVAPLDEGASFEWLVYLRQKGHIEVPEEDRDDLLSSLLCSSGLPPLDLPDELRCEEVKLTTTPRLRVRPPSNEMPGRGRFRADLSFDYEGRSVEQEEKARGWYEGVSRRFLHRDTNAEKAAVSLLADLGIQYCAPTYWDRKSAWEIAPTKLPRIVRAVLEAGWHVEAEGKILRRPGAFRMDVSSGVDWFELRGEVQYGDSTAQLPELLQALHRGENMVRLGNGDYGILPEEWLRRFGPVAGMGTAVNGHLRFSRSQAGLLDALLAAQPEASCDEIFARVRQELRSFEGIQAAEQPPDFVGQLRDYQREGLGWMHFLRRFSFGGCLADDMGVGKTAQVLALLDGRRELKAEQKSIGPSLVVVPKSLVFNWKQEAARFTPRLCVLDYTGTDRSGSDLTDCDVVLTTYGTLRRDVLRLKEIEFDYIVLDEAQAVKNSGTESSKAVRLLRGQHRLALSGTPIENHLGELWTLFEFLNPGMLGTGNAFKLLSGSPRNPNDEARRLLASALRPFILRRTKEQVARELPPKTEQTIYCVMEPTQRKLYKELLQHYRDSLLKRIETEGMAKSKIQVLEALLRLRQAACHPGLLDPKRKTEPSAKLEVLLARITEVIEEGHKALVFSQFTSFLGLLRPCLDEKSVQYEYLDGATRDRQARVERFQNDPDCRLFLVSLKAGGLGLNLTAAEYVFILDPWWNPAVEAQAVDRAHRIGQTQRVFAYRLIAKDTVEEKVLELQQSKRDLAAAIISVDNSLIRDLQREDLEILLS